ncbi:CaiB/BaiF CoA-transferase family protein [Brevundimonas sp. NIBR11]|uniref:CaiB/BaiF CoA transferase family protein n=1 Tax=Brevundimonas sp. NIBR11 TaxID=3015999 RepID=UPI0022F108CB|nr:CaiB/BaiF CoA-transferase family protein [Brevundimonas sp. NIBR11]WGM30445.1 Acetyl-CoA:oxalate CoA-transferase [Brevundimonas sp. NIBR11]
MKPLSGVRIIEFDGLGPVTFAGMVLADLGADVLRLSRAAAGAFGDVGNDVMHRARNAVVVDLKSPEDRDRVLDLIATADAVIEGFRPGVLERLGLGPEDCAARNPKLVFGRVTGWGQTGPLSQTVGHDINYIGLTGALHAMGEAGRPPVPPLNLVGDYGAGAMLLVAGVLAGVIEARTTGKGRVVDAAMTDGAALLSALFFSMAAGGHWGERGSNLLDGAAPFYRCYACSDGKFVAVGALEPRFYAALLAGLGLDPVEAPQMPVSQWPVLESKFAALFASRTRDDWAAHFAGTEACVTPVLSFAEAADHPHNRDRGTLAGSPLQPRPAPRFDGQVAPIEPAGSLSLDEALTRWG